MMRNCSRTSRSRYIPTAFPTLNAFVVYRVLAMVLAICVAVGLRVPTAPSYGTGRPTGNGHSDRDAWL